MRVIRNMRKTNSPHDIGGNTSDKLKRRLQHPMIRSLPSQHVELDLFVACGSRRCYSQLLHLSSPAWPLPCIQAWEICSARSAISVTAAPVLISAHLSLLV